MNNTQILSVFIPAGVFELDWAVGPGGRVGVCLWDCLVFVDEVEAFDEAAAPAAVAPGGVAPGGVAPAAVAPGGVAPAVLEWGPLTSLKTIV